SLEDKMIDCPPSKVHSQCATRRPSGNEGKSQSPVCPPAFKIFCPLPIRGDPMIENQISGVDAGKSAAGQPLPNAPDVRGIDESEVLALARQFNAGSSWFFWIAALSVINSLIAVFGGNWRFIFGLGITSVADALFSQSGGVAKAIGFVFTLLI